MKTVVFFGLLLLTLTTFAADVTTTKGETTKADGTTTTGGDHTVTTTTKKEEGTTTKKEEGTTTKKEETTTTKSDKTTTTRGDGTTTTKDEKTTTSKPDEHGQENCENLDVCTKYARCAEIIYPEKDECKGSCSACVNTEVYGSCEYYRRVKGSDKYTIQCYGDSELVQVPRCKSRKCEKLWTSTDCLSAEHCVWVEEADQCIGDYCGHCIYSPLSCDIHKECYDSTTTLRARIHRCSVHDVQNEACTNSGSGSGDDTNKDSDEGEECTKCTDLGYDKCVGTNGCAWFDVDNYYDDDNCPTGCGYCDSTCHYGGNNTCAQVKEYDECRKAYTDEVSDTDEDQSSGSSDGNKYPDTNVKKIYCEGDTQPENLGRCFLRNDFVEDKKRCEGLSYDDCMKTIATDNTGGCAYLVTDDCDRLCGSCVSIGISCDAHKKCYDGSSDNGKSQTFYCNTDDKPPTTSCKKYCTGSDAESCLKESDHCVWHQYKSVDYRCGWCDFVCDSCEKAQKRVASAYNSTDYFNGGNYDIICSTDDTKLLKDCHKCYGKKSECANAYCLDQVKSCNADSTCSDRAFKVMCMQFGENDGSYFYEQMVKEDRKGEDSGSKSDTNTGSDSEGSHSGSDGEGSNSGSSNDGSGDDGVTDNQALLNLAKCMKHACFDDTDDEITNEYDNQASQEPVCSFGYAELNYAFTICLDSTTVADLCKENYAKRFDDVIETTDAAKVYWRYLNDVCKLFESSSRRLTDVAVTTNIDDVSNPWPKITESTEIPQDPPSSENCLSLEISITYPTQEDYKTDKEKYASIASTAQNLKPGAQVTIDTWSIECCKEDDICQNMQGSSVAVSTLFAIIAAIATFMLV